MLWSILRLPSFLFTKLFTKTYTMVIYTKSGNVIRIKNVTDVEGKREGTDLTKISIKFISLKNISPMVFVDLKMVEFIGTE